MHRRLAALTLLLSMATPFAQAQTFPDRPVRLVVPFAAGGAVDFVARLIGPELGTRLGQPVVVENRTGAAGAIGAQAVARAAPDGTMLLMAPITSLSMLAGLPGSNVPFDLDRDFAPVALVGAVPLVVVVHPTVPARTLGELIAHARRNPGQLSFASAGIGSTEHLSAELLMSMSGARMVHVPYRGGAPAMMDVVGGQVQVMVATSPTVMQSGGTGVRALAIATARRSAALPDVPTAAEAGLAGYEVSTIYAVLAPAGTPADRIARLNREIVAAVRQDQVVERLRQQGIDPTPSTPAEAGAAVRSEMTRWAEVIRAAGITGP